MCSRCRSSSSVSCWSASVSSASASDTSASFRSAAEDRKSTRLNSSHSQISYAVFCLKKKPTYTYLSMGSKSVRLVATNTKGCRDTTFKNIAIVDKPPITLGFRDTLICIPDALKLQAAGNGIFSWTPGTAMVNGNTAFFIDTPATTETYTLSLHDALPI